MLRLFSGNRARSALASLLVLCCVGAAGCGGKYGPQKTRVEAYPTCYEPIAYMRDKEYRDVRASVTGIVVGGLLGTVGGALGGALTGKAEGVVAGMVMGAVVGGAIGNIYVKKSLESDDNKRLASYLEDIDGDISDMDLAKASATKAIQCYDRAFIALIRDIKERKIDQAAAEKRFAEIMNGREEAAAVMGVISQNATQLKAEYEKAIEKESGNVLEPRIDANAGKEQVERYKRRVRDKKKNASTITSAKKKTEILSARIKEMEQSREEISSQNASLTAEMNEIMASMRSARS